jgi:two-component system OmpR family response regulator
VLIVEDDPALRSLLDTRLGVLGFDTRMAADGAVALARIEDFRPQAMILDINMPHVDGFKVMARLGRERMAKLPTLALTARHAADDVRMAVSLGARDYLAKPFDDAQFLSRVGRLFRARRQP